MYRLSTIGRPVYVNLSPKAPRDVCEVIGNDPIPLENAET